MFQDTVANLSSGPEPPFFKELIIPLIPNIVDRPPMGKNFGDVLQPPNPKYRVVRLTKRSWRASKASVWRLGLGGGRRCSMAPSAFNDTIDQLLATVILIIVLISVEALQT